jgi:hypothetical protein
MATTGQRFWREAWRDVRVNFTAPCQGESEREDAVMAVLRRNFREGPAAAANAQAAYKSWVHGVVEVGGSDPMPPAARRWSGFVEEWARYDSGNIGGFAEIDGIDFSQVPKETPEQKPKQRMRMRM